MSSDKGESWVKIKDSLDFEIHRMAINSRGVIFAYGLAGIDVSSDTGREWSHPCCHFGVEHFSICPNGDIVFGGYYSLFLSKDGCKSWTRYDDLDFENVSFNAVGVSRRGVIVFGSDIHGRAVYGSADGGKSWCELRSQAVGYSASGLWFTQTGDIIFQEERSQEYRFFFGKVIR